MHNSEENVVGIEKTNAFWYPVYLAVIVTTIAVIAALAFFSNYFSK